MAAKVTDKNKDVVVDPSPAPDPVAPTPTFVPADEFRQFQATINGQFQTFQENFNAILTQLGSRKNDTLPEPVIEDVTREEIEQVLADGKGADKIVKLIDDRLKKMEGVFGKRVQDLENIGLTAISEHSKDLAIGDMPYYSKFKKEIDAYIATLPARLRVSKQIYVVAHNAIVGQHLPDILKEEREKILREAAEPEDATQPTGINGRDRGTKKDEISTVEELLGKSAADALVGIGRTPDQHAAHMGYKDWKTFATFVKTQEERLQADA